MKYDMLKMRVSGRFQNSRAQKMTRRSIRSTLGSRTSLLRMATGLHSGVARGFPDGGPRGPNWGRKWGKMGENNRRMGNNKEMFLSCPPVESLAKPLGLQLLKWSLPRHYNFKKDGALREALVSIDSVSPDTTALFLKPYTDLSTKILLPNLVRPGESLI